MSESVRCFVAVDLSEPVRDQVARLQQQVRPPSKNSGQALARDVRWVKPELMHLTLAFLGEVPSSFIESARTVLADRLPQLSAFRGRLSGLGAFPSPSRARVVWVGMDQGSAELCRLQQAVVRALEPVGHRPDTAYVSSRRPFSPHLTLGRLRVPADVGPIVALGFESDQFDVGRVVLYRSVLDREGPSYSALDTFLLPPDSSSIVHRSSVGRIRFS